MKILYVDLPDPLGVEDKDRSWVNVAIFRTEAGSTHEDVVGFLKEH